MARSHSRLLSPNAVLWITLLLGALSIAVAVLNVFGVRQAGQVIARGEGANLLSELHRRQQQISGPLGDQALQLFASQNEGVSYVAVLGPRGEVLSVWGESVFPDAQSESEEGANLERYGQTYRLRDKPPPARQAEPGPPGRRDRPNRDRPDDLDRPDRRPPPDARGPDSRRRDSLEPDANRPNRRRPPPHERRRRGPRGPGQVARFTLEFESQVTGALEARAQQGLLIGGLVGALFLGGAILLRRLLIEREADQLRRYEEGRLRSLGEMSAVLAHEIRNPLASLKGNAQLLAESTEGEPSYHRMATRVVHEATRLEELSSDLLEFVRTGPLDRRETRVEELVHQAVVEVGDGIATDLSRAPATWTLDAVRVGQVLTNLLRNARAATPDGAPIEVEVSEQQRQLRFAVRDRGPGIEPENLERIFEPFFTTRTDGTGLGLAVARRFIEMHGGTLEASNRQEGGARFIITLPQVAPSKAEKETPL